ncbi:MAG: hypothetical protein ACOH18_02530 [Candidatus Saccharimonadaceae bacterium]
MNERLKKATEYFKKVDAQEISFSEARQSLLKDGYSEDEISEAIAEYSDNKPVIQKKPDAIVDEATLAIANRKVTFITEKSLQQDQIESAAMSFLVPNNYAKNYFFTKFLKSHADAKNIDENGKIGPTEGKRLYERYRFIQYNGRLSVVILILGLIVAGPSLLNIVLQAYWSVTRGHLEPGIVILFVVALLGWFPMLTMPLVLYFAKKESTLKAYVIGLCIIPGIVGIILGLIIQNYIIAGLSLLFIVYSLWQSNRVGILSVLGRN